MGRLTAEIILGVLVGLLAACSNPPFSPSSDDYFNPPKGDEDAELMALCLSSRITAADDLYNQVARDLAHIRAIYGDTVPQVNHIKFRPPWLVSCVIVGFDDATAALVSRGEYHAWDELNSTLHLTRIDMQGLGLSKLAVLYFDDRLHPRRLADLYGALPGIRYAEPNGIMGDFPNVYPRNTEVGLTFLFRAAWGDDCMAGCSNSEFWYFSRALIGRPLALVCHWLSGPRSAPPLLCDALKNMELWHTF